MTDQQQQQQQQPDLSSLMDQSALPNIPGYRVDFDPRTTFAKSHWFDFKNDFPMGDLRLKSQLSSTVDTTNTAAPAPTTTTTAATKQTTEGMQVSPELSGPSKMPSWVIEARTLCWFGYFTEKIENSAIEKERIHKLKICYHCVDGTFEISDLKDESPANSGIVTGKFLKRQRIPRDFGPQSMTGPASSSSSASSLSDEGTLKYLDAADFSIGASPMVFGRAINIVDCDDFTRKHAKEALGIEYPMKLSWPKDDFAKHEEQNEYYRELSKSNGASDVRAYCEALLGRQSHDQLLKQRQFLENDKKVLRFWGQWIDPSVDPKMAEATRVHRYEIHYFLADDTVQVRNLHDKGRQSFPLLLTRRKMPKAYVPHGTEFGIDHTGEIPYVTYDDFAVGKHINVFGRQVLLTKADPFTIQWYCNKFPDSRNKEDFKEIITEDDILLKAELAKKQQYFQPKKKCLSAAMSASNSNNNSMNKQDPIKAAQQKKRAEWYKMKYGDAPLRFLGQLYQAQYGNEQRRFVIEFYMADSTVKIFERSVRNSGFLGGKFLERTKLYKQLTNNNSNEEELYTPEDFAVGSIVTLNSWKFEILETDPQTQRLYTYGNPIDILRTLAIKLYDQNYQRSKTFRIIDTDRTGTIDRNEMREIAAKYAYTLSDEQLDVLFNYFDRNGSGQIDADEFFTSLDEIKHDGGVPIDSPAHKH